MAKRILQVFLVIVFILLVVCGIIVGSYVFASPNTDANSDGRLLISGAWIDEKSDKKLEVDENGKFKYSELKSGEVIADGWYRLDETRKALKLFVLPGHHTEAFDSHINLFFFAQISYSNLTDAKNVKKVVNKETYKLEDAPKCTFLIKNNGDNEGVVLNMIMPEKTLELYSHGKHFSAKKV
ncbi:hypothetical protein SAMN02910317_01849 [Ruminococcaceae bacterium FB2012]|nr:hypothetical protein SAMN02910317_01849 [Ruminococcaceae bacterium FB2012]